jgi:hypothetical protein
MLKQAKITDRAHTIQGPDPCAQNHHGCSLFSLLFPLSTTCPTLDVVLPLFSILLLRKKIIFVYRKAHRGWNDKFLTSSYTPLKSQQYCTKKKRKMLLSLNLVGPPTARGLQICSLPCAAGSLAGGDLSRVGNQRSDARLVKDF